MDDNKSKVQKIKDSIAKHTKDDGGLVPGGSLEIVGIMSGETKEQILARFTKAALGNQPAEYDKSHAFWSGFREGVAYVTAMLKERKDGKGFDELDISDKLYLATGIEAADIKINQLKS